MRVEDLGPEASRSSVGIPRGRAHGASMMVPRCSLQELLQSLPDRRDLERLYQRQVPLTQILRLLGHHVDRGQIDYLLHCDDPQGEIHRILGSV